MVIPIEIYFLAASVLLVLATYIWQFRKIPGVREQIFVQVGKSIWLLCLVWVSVMKSLEAKIIAFKLLLLLYLLISYFWLSFILKISQQGNSLIRKFRCIFLTMIFFQWAFILTDFWHGEISRGLSVSGDTFLVTFYLPYQLIWGSGYVLYAISYIFALRWIFISSGMRRRHAVLFTASAAISLAGGVVNNMPFLVSGALPAAFLLSGVLISWGCYRWHAFSIFNLAEKAAVEHMFEGLLVLDEKGYVVTMNPAARLILKEYDFQLERPFAELEKMWPSLGLVRELPLGQSGEVVSETSAGSRYYQVAKISLQVRKAIAGTVILFKDITRQKKIQEQLVEREKALSVLQERARIGRELHDGQGQIWSYLSFELSQIKTAVLEGRAEQAAEKAEKLIGLTRDRHSDIRENIVGLRKTVAVSKSQEYDFIRSLQEYIAWYEQTYGISVKQDFQGELLTMLRYKTAVQLLRILQEALTNIRKHAKAKHIEVSFRQKKDGVYVEIRDDGCGFDLEHVKKTMKNRHFGLQIMAERTREAGGEIKIESKNGRGTCLQLYFPAETVPEY